MSYPSYLVHYNQNHSAKNGQFISGDGDGDGISNDHKNQKKTNNSFGKKVASTTQKIRNRRSQFTTKQKVIMGTGAVAATAAVALSAATLIKEYSGKGKETVDTFTELKSQTDQFNSIYKRFDELSKLGEELINRPTS